MSIPKNASDMLILPTNPPHQVWLAENGDIPGLVDPDADRRPRWHDRDTLNWKAIGDAVESAGRRLIAGEFSMDEAGDCSLTINLEPYRFSAAEVETVASWFWIAGPHGDPSITKPTDGRHRLWNVWKHNPHALLPISSDALTSSSSSSAFTILRFAPVYVLDRNPAYRDALRRAAT